MLLMMPLSDFVELFNLDITKHRPCTTFVNALFPSTVSRVDIYSVLTTSFDVQALAEEYNMCIVIISDDTYTVYESKLPDARVFILRQIGNRTDDAYQMISHKTYIQDQFVSMIANASQTKVCVSPYYTQLTAFRTNNEQYMLSRKELYDAVWNKEQLVDLGMSRTDRVADVDVIVNKYVKDYWFIARMHQELSLLYDVYHELHLWIFTAASSSNASDIAHVRKEVIMIGSDICGLNTVLDYIE